MSSTIPPVRDRASSVVSVIGVALLAAGVVAAIIIRIVTMVSAASGPMQVLGQAAYTGYALAPAKPYVNPYALADALVLVAFGVAAFGLVALVLGVALHATKRRSH